ncbi:hypothetical protein HNP84_004883 [Thermocatellispora tengchongensis]|uniref:LysM domain-containing protein n=1 Tax=Thermocatellispora tengchongensis TaxID=1073253 RepID=A0A840PDA6_9ACTN|nr:LysM peptidoglycan-binding domain-containing protein [Thermocatellispora tengchongensis]MBB5135147.1 hypothetical protein [Thermocatellispora tengchongensis]
MGSGGRRTPGPRAVRAPRRGAAGGWRPGTVLTAEDLEETTVRPAPSGRPGARPSRTTLRKRRHPAPPLRLTRRGRVVLVVAVAMIALGVFWLGTRAVGIASTWHHPGSQHAGLPWVVVGQGDTLWEIADAVSPEADPAPMVRKIMNLNGLSSTVITPGMRLYVPLSQAG